MALNATFKYGSEDITSLNLDNKEIVLDTLNTYCQQNISVNLNFESYNKEVVTIDDITSIQIVTPPTKVFYPVEDVILDITGIKVMAFVGSELILDITDECSYVANDMKNGELTSYSNTITVIWHNFTTTLPISVIGHYLTFTAITPELEPEDEVAIGFQPGSGLELNIEYSTDKINWTQCPPEGTRVSLLTTGKVYFRGNNSVLCTKDVSSYFFTYGPITSLFASGNLNTLLSYTETVLDLSARPRCFYQLFRNCYSELQLAPELPATTLGAYCYARLFEGNYIKDAPKLPATTLADACYWCLFGANTLLTTPPELPAIELAITCYCSMFQGCTSLSSAPVLPATSLADNCYYQMFQNCTSLIQVPELPATTLADNCYFEMFNGCTSLTIADSPSVGYNTIWTIPTSRTFTNTTTQSNMFLGCLGTRSTDSPTFTSGASTTYYIKNTFA